MSDSLMLSLLLSAATTIAACQDANRIELTVRDDDGPVANASVCVGFAAGRDEDSKLIAGATDEQGRFSADGSARLYVKVDVEKDGYYPSAIGRLSKGQDHVVDLRLRRIGNPVSLCAKLVIDKLPGLEQPYGFDLRLGDWVQPHGPGKEPHLFFTGFKDVASPTEYTTRIRVTFPNEGDGIAVSEPLVTESKFQGLRSAEGNWDFKESLEIALDEGNGQSANDFRGENHLVRCRTVLDGDGSVVRANYARIDGGIKPMSGRTGEAVAGLKMKYYYNPRPNDTNLEYDPTQPGLDPKGLADPVMEP